MSMDDTISHFEAVLTDEDMDVLAAYARSLDDLIVARLAERAKEGDAEALHACAHLLVTNRTYHGCLAGGV